MSMSAVEGLLFILINPDSNTAFRDDFGLDSEENTKHAMQTRKSKQISGCSGMDSTETPTRNQLQHMETLDQKLQINLRKSVEAMHRTQDMGWATSATTNVAGRQ
jgi:hypothetical protein